MNKKKWNLVKILNVITSNVTIEAPRKVYGEYQHTRRKALLTAVKDGLIQISSKSDRQIFFTITEAGKERHNLYAQIERNRVANLKKKREELNVGS